MTGFLYRLENVKINHYFYELWSHTLFVDVKKIEMTQNNKK